MTHHDRDKADTNSPPDRGAAGDVSTTGHSGRETEDIGSSKTAASTAGHASHVGIDDHGPADYLDELDEEHTGDAHAAHDGHVGHGDDVSDVPTLVPTTWRQLVFPALVLLLIAVLVWGPVTSAFQSRPAPPATTTEQHGGEPDSEVHEGVTATAQVTQPVNNATFVVPDPTGTVLPASVAPTSTPDLAALATRTRVEEEAETGVVARAPVQLQFATNEFVVKGGSSLLPDWTPPQDQGIATWIEGTYANHILYLPYSEDNEVLFRSAQPGDTMKLVMNTGQVFEFDVTRSERAFNGPSTDRGRFTVTSAMSQDHAGVTLFLIGDPADDRAVVQADFNGNIQ